MDLKIIVPSIAETAITEVKGSIAHVRGKNKYKAVFYADKIKLYKNEKEVDYTKIPVTIYNAISELAVELKLANLVKD